MMTRILKFAFYLFYNQFAFTYEWVAWLVSFGRWGRWRQSVVQTLQAGNTLELAFGTGVLFSQLEQANIAVFGIDLSPFMARITARRLRRLALPLTIARADALALPFPAESFSNIIATFPTDYIFDRRTLANIHRLLHANGQLVIVMQGDLLGFGVLSNFIEWLYRITGQRAVAADAVIARLTATKFSARWERLTFQGAVAQVLIAQKK